MSFLPLELFLLHACRVGQDGRCVIKGPSQNSLSGKKKQALSDIYAVVGRTLPRWRERNFRSVPLGQSFWAEEVETHWTSAVSWGLEGPVLLAQREAEEDAAGSGSEPESSFKERSLRFTAAARRFFLRLLLRKWNRPLKLPRDCAGLVCAPLLSSERLARGYTSGVALTPPRQSAPSHGVNVGEGLLLLAGEAVLVGPCYHPPSRLHHSARMKQITSQRKKGH